MAPRTALLLALPTLVGCEATRPPTTDADPPILSLTIREGPDDRARLLAVRGDGRTARPVTCPPGTTLRVPGATSPPTAYHLTDTSDLRLTVTSFDAGGIAGLRLGAVIGAGGGALAVPDGARVASEPGPVLPGAGEQALTVSLTLPAPLLTAAELPVTLDAAWPIAGVTARATDRAGNVRELLFVLADRRTTSCV